MVINYHEPFDQGSIRFARLRSALPEVKIREVMIHEPSSFVLKTWRQTSLDSYEALSDSTRFARSRVSRKSTSGMTNRQQGNNSCRFHPIDSNRQHFQPTLHSPLEVKIHEIKIHEPFSFSKRCHKLRSIRTIRVDSIESSRIDNIFNPPYIVQGRYILYVSRKSTSVMSNRQQGKRLVSIPTLKAQISYIY